MIPFAIIGWAHGPLGQREPLDEKAARLMIGGEGKPPLKFVYDGKYEKERQIVRKLTRLGEYELFHKALHGKAKIGIALVDLNGDGQDDILACVHHYALDTSGQCVLLVFISHRDESWIKVFEQATLGDYIFVLGSKHVGHNDIMIEGRCRPLIPGHERDSCLRKITLGFDGQQYRFLFLLEIERDPEAGVTTTSIPKCETPGVAPGVVDVR